MGKITTCLWFDGNAEEAANYYTSVFKNSKVTQNSGLVVNFELDGRTFMGLNGGPMFKFNEAVSMVIHCKDQDEIDYYWEKLSAVPQAEQCGWVKDKFGLSWQIIPSDLGKLMTGDPKKSKRTMEALLKMKKLDISLLEQAYNG